jgi:hypothetical protein
MNLRELLSPIDDKNKSLNVPIDDKNELSNVGVPPLDTEHSSKSSEISLACGGDFAKDNPVRDTLAKKQIGRRQFGKN